MHDHLLAQARRLARLDPNKPKQASLRRAVSGAYYGLFHFLIDQSCRITLGAHHDQAPYRQVLGRAFHHGTMKDACKSFAAGALKAGAAKGLPASFSIPADIKTIADTFVELQDKRQLADYDLTERFTRSDVLGLIQEVEISRNRFRQLAPSDEKNFFLACLWAWNSLSKR